MNAPVTDLNNKNTTGLPLRQTFILVFCLTIWAVLFISLMRSFPVESQITPAVWYYLTTLLLLWLILRRLKTDSFRALALKPTAIKWWMMATLVGLGYWWIDHWLTTEIFAVDTQQSIAQWQYANQQFLAVSVMSSSVLLAPLFEELVFRGLILRSLSAHMNGWLAAIISALLFAAIHMSWPAFINIFIAGLFYAWLTTKSNSILPAILAHVIHNSLTYWLYSQTVTA